MYDPREFKAAACREVDPELFFPPSRLKAWRAKEICGACPVRVPCLTYAVETRQEHGVWGGVDEQDRRRMIALRHGPGSRANINHARAGGWRDRGEKVSGVREDGAVARGELPRARVLDGELHPHAPWCRVAHCRGECAARGSDLAAGAGG